MYSNLLYSQNSRSAISIGVNKLADMVQVTLGPKGRNVLIRNLMGNVKITKDGVTVARSITLEDPAEDSGAVLIKECANRTADVAGDGTTTATILARALYNDGLALLENSPERINVVQLQRGMTDAAAEICSALEKLSLPVTGPDQVKAIATISANGDSVIGGLIGDVINQVGRDGYITIEDSPSTSSSYEITPGVELETGFIHPIFITNKDREETHFEDFNVLVIDKRIDRPTLRQMISLLQCASALVKPILVICQDISEDAILDFASNISRGLIKMCAIKAPGYGNKRTDIMEDLAALTGSIMVNDIVLNDLYEAATKYEATISKPAQWADFKMAANLFGHGDSVTVTKEKSALICQADADEGTSLGDRIGLLHHLIETSSSEFDIEQYKKRLARLISGVAVIRVGAETEPEQQELKDRVEDALHATQAAISEGVLPGGGAALEYLAWQGMPKPVEQTPSYLKGHALLQDALRIPMETILTNAGFKAGDLMEALDTAHTEGDHLGVNADTGEICDMVTNGILDPLRVTKTAVTNAASVAGVLLTTEGMIWQQERQSILESLEG